jgi:hypothetical protein
LRRPILLGLVVVVIPLYGSAWATTDLTTLSAPDVTITPSTGPPSTKITITVSHLPDISNETYPYPDLYVYLPFSQPFGLTVPSHCGGEDCFPIYTYDDALKQNFENRTITLSLFSTNNPGPVFLNGYENSVCDVVLNGKTVQRYSVLCNAKDEPTGTYQIKLVWTLESDLEQSFTTKTLQFIVTSGFSSPPPPVAENGNTVIKQYQNGIITGSEFESNLRTLGWSDEQIRQALAVIGKLPHQVGGSGPDHTQEVLQQMNAQNNTMKTSLPIVENNIQQSPGQNNPVPIPQQNRSSFTSQPIILSTIPQSSSWNNVAIAIAVGTVGVMAGLVFVVKKTGKGRQ